MTVRTHGWRTPSNKKDFDVWAPNATAYNLATTIEVAPHEREERAVPLRAHFVTDSFRDFKCHHKLLGSVCTGTSNYDFVNVAILKTFGLCGPFLIGLM